MSADEDDTASNAEIQLKFRALYASPIVAIHDYVCSAHRGGPDREEQSDTSNVVLMRHGAFCKQVERRSVTADVNQAVFFSRGLTYQVSHPADCGDRGTVLSPTPRVLNDIIRELDPSIDEHPQRPFPFIAGPCTSDVFWRHRAMVQRLENAESAPLEPLWADVTALQLVADVLEPAFARHGLPRKSRRDATDADHANRVEAAKTYLATMLSERITLDDVARAVYASPFHLARVFQAKTGVPVHRYLTLLRLRASLERIADGASDLTVLALELGFSSHSHFTDAFRKEFGSSPSDVRRSAGSKSLREMSKNLEV
ncbi:MAG: AraC family transcriptional regulator [Acidobacteriota bacterium]